MNLNNENEKILIEEVEEFRKNYINFFGGEIFFRVLPVCAYIHNLKKDTYYDEVIVEMLNKIQTSHSKELFSLGREFDEINFKELFKKLNINIKTSKELLDIFSNTDEKSYNIVQKYQNVVSDVVKVIESFINRYEEMKEKDENFELKIEPKK